MVLVRRAPLLAWPTACGCVPPRLGGAALLHLRRGRPGLSARPFVRARLQWCCSHTVPASHAAAAAGAHSAWKPASHVTLSVSAAPRRRSGSASSLVATACPCKLGKGAVFRPHRVQVPCKRRAWPVLPFSRLVFPDSVEFGGFQRTSSWSLQGPKKKNEMMACPCRPGSANGTWRVRLACASNKLLMQTRCWWSARMRNEAGESEDGDWPWLWGGRDLGDGVDERVDAWMCETRLADASAAQA